ARPLLGKDIAVPSARFPAEWYPKENRMSTTAPVAGAPYSATETMTTKVLNSEGMVVGTARQRTLQWRDSAGRFRDEEFFEIEGHPNAFPDIPPLITAVDTVQHCQFTWSDSVNPNQDGEAVVNCNSLEVSRGEDGLARSMTDPKPEIAHEQYGPMATTTTTTPLGKRTIQGLEAVGVRSVTTEVDAEGKPQGTKEAEIWWSPALYESLIMTVKTGQNIVTWEMTGIERSEPDAKLFYPPDGYSIRKEEEMPPLPVPAQP
ncbi:MAG: hypothetical protein M3R43_12640, partial [Acidobacteriota bacterium]|nr:hypothetical protein [Acidobacteriota bacterium]